MPHQRGETPISFGHGGLMRDGRDPSPLTHSMHPGEFQRRRVGEPRALVHHPSPGGQPAAMHPRHLHPTAVYGGHSNHAPHSPGWYGSSVASSSPHRVPGGSALSVATTSSGEHESIMEEHYRNTREIIKKNDSSEVKASQGEMQDKASVIQEAIKKHVDEEYSIGTSEADAASALLFATSAMRRAVHASSKVSVAESKTGLQEPENDGDNNDGHEENDESRDSLGEDAKKQEPLESSVPLKKRRKLLEFLRKKPVETAGADKQHLHVSPLPSPQVRNRIADHESSEETTVTSASPPRANGSSLTCMAGAYNMKGAQCLHEGSKINDAAEISPPPAQVVINDFPTVLHDVLTNSDFAGNVVQWLPGGKTWKIIRWDALRRKVLPKHFPQLRDEYGKVVSSIDAFLWHLASWGFEEVQSGPDIGAYTHELFHEDSPQLCQKMNFEPKENSELESPTAPKKCVNAAMDASQPHSILQVPSLASRTGSESEGAGKDDERTRKWREEEPKNGGNLHSPAIAYPSMRGRPMRHPETPIFVNYRVGEMSYSDGWQYFPDSPVAMRHIDSAMTNYERRLLQQQHYELAMPSRTPFALQSPPRVQSGRGALRLASSRRIGLTMKAERPGRTPSFPVSNRGKGRGSPALRIPLPTDSVQSGPAAKAVGSETNAAEEDAEKLQKFSEEVAQRVAIAISKKTKRKLPVSCGGVTSQETLTREAKDSLEELAGVDKKRGDEGGKKKVMAAEA